MTDTANYPTMQRIADLQMFIANFARVERMIHLADTGRLENDVEHSYGLALTCWYLAPKIAPELDLAKILQYALAHDTVEIHAGDTFVFAKEGQLNSKSDREDSAIEAIAQEWPDFPDLADFAAGYKAKRDEEAKFVYSVDKLLPTLMVNLGEKAAFWNRHKITAAMMAEKKRNVMTAASVAPYYQQLMDWLTNPDYFYREQA